MVRVLLVAPVTFVQVGEVVDQILALDGLRVRLVRTPATRRAINDALDRGTFEVLVFLGHGQLDGLQLDDGLMGIADVLMVVDGSRCEVCVLESCQSVALASEIVKRTGSSCMATIVDQPVERAAQVVLGFLRNVASGLPAVQSFLLSALHDGNSIYFRALSRSEL